MGKSQNRFNFFFKINREARGAVPAEGMENFFGENSVEDIYVHSGGTKLHYRVGGQLSKPPLVLLHGIGGSVNWWDKNLPALTPHFRTYALDLPGFGLSWRSRQPYSIDRLAIFLKEWLDYTGLEKISLLGHSMGGQVAARFAGKNPERVQSLVLAAPSGLWPTGLERLRWFRDAPRVKVPFQQVITIASGTMRTDALALLLSLKAITGDGLKVTESFQLLRTPTLLLWGTADTVLPPSLAARVSNLITGAPKKLEFIPDGTHDMMFDQAETFNRLTLNFLINNLPVNLLTRPEA